MICFQNKLIYVYRQIKVLWLRPIDYTSFYCSIGETTLSKVICIKVMKKSRWSVLDRSPIDENQTGIEEKTQNSQKIVFWCTEKI